MHSLTRRKRVTAVLLLVLAVFIGTTAESCSGDSNNDSHTRDNSYTSLLQSQPAHSMDYSPTRDTINFWIDTWNHPGKLSYVYLQNASGKIIGYYVFKGLPVTSCAALTPTWKFYDGPGDSVFDEKAPSVDGVYYSGGQCTEYYGKDATSGSFVDYTVGLGINVLLYDQPLPPQQVGDAPHLGPTSVDDVKK
jgi:hypothetical protein